MATFISNDNQIETSEHLHEFQKMMNEVLQFDMSLHTKNRLISTDDQNIDQALLSLDNCVDSKQRNIINTNTTVSFADHNVGAKQFSLLYTNTIKSNEEPIDENTNQQKRHIMISYNHSSIKTCRKIYNRLVERNYNVWMDVEHMFDDILVTMARAVENSYIILLCMNQQYYESDYCRLEAEYAVKKSIKFIPCLMEKSFHPKSWLGIIKGSNIHIDFSSLNHFNKSFEQLIRQITYIEKNLSLQPRRNPVSIIPTDVNLYNFERNYQLNELNQNELSKLRQDLFNETKESLSDSDQSDEEFLQEFIYRILEQNELLLKLINRLTKQQNRRYNLNADTIIKLVLTIILLWTLIIVCQK